MKEIYRYWAVNDHKGQTCVEVGTCGGMKLQGLQKLVKEGYKLKYLGKKPFKMFE